jgi:putative membrane-bound dehydrogenase-like protein
VKRLALAALLAAAGCGKKYVDAPPMSAEKSLGSMRLSEDFRVELFLSEPQVVDPVEMVWDENGRIYVAEMRDYPDDPPKGQHARSRIKLLEDADGDGRYERATVFAERVLQVSGLHPWKGGLLVTSAPEILYMKDTDGDGRADVRDVLYTGFPLVNSEGRITNLRYGLDNWIWAANSGANGTITSPAHPAQPPVLVRGADFRFHLVRGVAEAASGPTQFGMSFDDWGNRFLSQNTVHLRHAVIPMHYLRRAPFLETGAVSEDISDHGKPSAPMFPLTRPQLWRRQRTSLRQKRYDENKLEKIERLEGFFTAATGGTVYTGDVFPEEYRGNVFTGDVSANLVHRDILRPAGVTFTASRAKEGVEFLASTDVWFRPCNFANAPDGHLYMIDIYREFIETPESIPEEIKKGMNFYSGDTMGRIYRIVPKQPRKKRALQVNLGRASTDQLVGLLAETNGWHRYTAQRLLVERQAGAAVAPLRDMAATHPSPLARLHALWTLEGLSALEEPLILKALRDSHPGLREQALRLAEPFLAKSRPMLDAALAAARDAEVRVQFQAALTLGGSKDPRALDALAELGLHRGADRWFRLAVLSSAADRVSSWFHLVLAKGRPDSRLAADAAALIGARRNPGEIARLLAALPKTPEPEACLSGLARGFRLVGAKRLRVPGAEAALGRFASTDAAWEAARYLEVPGLMKRAAADALAANLPEARRAVATRALCGGEFSIARDVFRRLLESHAPAGLQVAAVEAIAEFDDPAVGTALLEPWRAYSPEARAKAVAAMLNHRARVPLFLKALEDGRVEASNVDVTARARLLEDPDKGVAERARRILASAGGERAKVVESYRDALALRGDVRRGKQVFERECSKCHMPRRLGGERVGPDLSGINNKTKEELLTSILNPSYAIEARFTNYIVTTKDGRIHDGIIAGETPGVITLRNGAAEGDENLLRENVAEVRASSISLMPDELEKTMSKQDLADVISYLRGGL